MQTYLRADTVNNRLPYEDQPPLPAVSQTDSKIIAFFKYILDGNLFVPDLWEKKSPRSGDPMETIRLIEVPAVIKSVCNGALLATSMITFSPFPTILKVAICGLMILGIQCAIEVIKTEIRAIVLLAYDLKNIYNNILDILDSNEFQEWRQRCCSEGGDRRARFD